MKDYTFLVIVILSLVIGNYVHEALGWVAFALGIAWVMHLQRADRIRAEELAAITQQPSIRRPPPLHRDREDG